MNLKMANHDIKTQWRTRLVSAHKHMQNAMEELINKQDYQEAERPSRLADKAIFELIADAGGYVVKE
jgi:hypothetical protein